LFQELHWCTEVEECGTGGDGEFGAYKEGGSGRAD